jgi:Na+-transporting NADH:ubiquinone oxidoreductase subunit NqrE
MSETPVSAHDAPTDQTNPLDAGHTTTEYRQARFVVILSSVLAILGYAQTVLDKVLPMLPEQSKGLGMWVAIAAVAVAGLTSLAYSIQRSFIKIAAIKAGQSAPATGDAASAAANLGKS